MAKIIPVVVFELLLINFVDIADIRKPYTVLYENILNGLHALTPVVIQQMVML